MEVCSSDPVCRGFGFDVKGLLCYFSESSYPQQTTCSACLFQSKQCTSGNFIKYQQFINSVTCINDYTSFKNYKSIFILLVVKAIIYANELDISQCLQPRQYRSQLKVLIQKSCHPQEIVRLRLPSGILEIFPKTPCQPLLA